jgi:hypothetical protein
MASVTGSIEFRQNRLLVAGVNSVRFYGWLSRNRKLKPGQIHARHHRDHPVLGSTSKTLTFTIVK